MLYSKQPFGQVPAFQDGDLLLFRESTHFINPINFQILLLFRKQVTEHRIFFPSFSESRAISRYVLRKYKTEEVNLLREGNLEESALVDVWLDVEALQFDPVMHSVFYQHRVVPVLGGTTDAKMVEVSIGKLKKVLDVYEAQLSKHRYLAGDFVSLADLSHFPETHYFMEMPHAAVFDSYPRVKAWLEDLMSRPAVKKVVKMMGQETH